MTPGSLVTPGDHGFISVHLAGLSTLWLRDRVVLAEAGEVQAYDFWAVWDRGLRHTELTCATEEAAQRRAQLVGSERAAWANQFVYHSLNEVGTYSVFCEPCRV